MNPDDVHARVLHVTSKEDVRQQLDGPPAIFLSAGIPYVREPAQNVTPAERASRARRNERFMAAAAPEETIDAAVVLFAREVLSRGMRLVFGAQPAVSEMLLSIGSDVVAAAPQRKPRILIFQSKYFEGKLPGSTLDLAAWDAGLLVFTPEVSRRQQPVEVKRREESLHRMRELMVSVPNLCAGVFIGGMEGVEAEEAIFRRHHPGKPTFPIASTGSAARFLFERAPAAYPDSLSKTPSPDDPVSYTLIAGDILDRVAPASPKQRKP